MEEERKRQEERDTARSERRIDDSEKEQNHDTARTTTSLDQSPAQGPPLPRRTSPSCKMPPACVPSRAYRDLVAQWPNLYSFVLLSSIFYKVKSNDTQSSANVNEICRKMTPLCNISDILYPIQLKNPSRNPRHSLRDAITIGQALKSSP